MGRIQTMHTRPILLVLLVAVLQVEASRRRPFSDAGRRSAWGGNWGGTRRRAPAPYSDTRRRAPYSDTRRRSPSWSPTASPTAAPNPVVQNTCVGCDARDGEWTIKQYAPLQLAPSECVKFRYALGTHNVYQFADKSHFDDCSFDGAQLIGSSSDGVEGLCVEQLQAGSFYYGCAMNGHCPAGQKLEVHVVARQSGRILGVVTIAGMTEAQLRTPAVQSAIQETIGAKLSVTPQNVVLTVGTSRRNSATVQFEADQATGSIAGVQAYLQDGGSSGFVAQLNANFAAAGMSERAISATATVNHNPHGSESQGDEGIDTLVLVAAAAGGAVVLTGIIGLAFWFYKRSSASVTPRARNAYSVDHVNVQIHQVPIEVHKTPIGVQPNQVVLDTKKHGGSRNQRGKPIKGSKQQARDHLSRSTMSKQRMNNYHTPPTYSR